MNYSNLYAIYIEINGQAITISFMNMVSGRELNISAAGDGAGESLKCNPIPLYSALLLTHRS